MKHDAQYLKKTSVVLTNDLTRYHKSLVVGVKGITVGRASQAVYNQGYNDRFVCVRFPETTRDILWESLELV